MNEHKIQWITARKTSGNEYKTFSKEVNITKKIQKAIVRFQSDCVCGLFVNGEFIISGTGHYPERVNCHDITCKLNDGINNICLRLGTRYYQSAGIEMKKIRGYWYSCAAFELEIVYADGETIYIPTDKTWKVEFDDAPAGEIYETIHIRDREYRDNWISAAVWEEQLSDINIDSDILSVAGNDFANYAKQAVVPEYTYPVSVYETNMTKDELCVDLPFETKERQSGEDRYVIFDFGRLVVGFANVELSVSEDALLTEYVDWAEKASELIDSDNYSGIVERLKVSETVTPDDKEKLSLYRRGMHYIKLVISGTDKPVKITGFSLRNCMYPVNRTGWFSCNDDILNDIWEVGKYTLHVNKQQEYESCPRNEMKFFSGDGIISAITDYYAFGDSALTDASLSLNYSAGCVGKVMDFSQADKNGLWDYPGWFIVMLYNEYKQTGDKNILARHYAEAVKNTEWYISRINGSNLIYNVQILSLPFHVDAGGTEWTDSGHRVGYKASLNSLVYHCLLCMAELSEVVGDGKSGEWRKIAADIREAINARLWSEEKQAYIDSEYDFIPQDGNAMAVLFGVADEERSKKALKTMRERLWTEYGSAICDVPIDNIQFARGGFNTIAPLICSYEAEANFVTRDARNALDLIRRCWGSMIKKGAKTFWEYAPNNEKEWGVRSHAWSTGCTYLLSAYVMGVRTCNYGWNKIIFDPQPGDLTEFRGVVPAPTGDIAVKYENKKYTIALPKDMEIETMLSNTELEIIRY